MKSRTLLSMLFCVSLFTGCAEWNVFRRTDWSDDEAKYGPTAQTQIRELQSLKSKAARMSPEDQTRASEDLAGRLRSEINPLIRSEIVLTLADFKTPAADAALKAAIEDNDSDVRIAACQAYAERKGPESARMLGRAVNSDTNIDVRLAAARALKEAGEPQIVPALAAALDDTDPALRYRVIEALEASSGENFGGDIAAWKNYARGLEPLPDNNPAVNDGSIIAERNDPAPRGGAFR